MSKISFVFPGQGSQSLGMLGELNEAFPLVSQTYQEASDALGLDLWALVSNGPLADLNLTHNTQPAMLAAGVSVWRVWKQQGGAAPALMAGHSLGEYSALVCAGALDFADAARLVAERGRFMQEAVPQGDGAMAAILGLEDDQIKSVCRQAAENEVVEAVNFNAPGQVVIAGGRAAVERCIELAKQAGAKRALPLPVSVPSHCSLMKPAAIRLAERLAEIQIDSPTIPVLHNVSVEAVDDPGQIRAMLSMQLYNPVRWVETVREMQARGIESSLEMGPGKVLAGLNKRIVKTMKALPVFDSATLAKALEETQHAD
jgi:[acyl-carrier-protein] S-malonyltransferase